MDNKLKWISIGTVGSLIALSHIGMIGMLAKRGNPNGFPTLNLPVGHYTSYSVKANKEGYAINYRANDPLVMGTTKEVTKPSGFLGVGKSKSIVQEQYTMDGARHHNGPVSTKSAWIDPSALATGTNEKKISDKTIACIKAQGGGEQTGRVGGGSVGAAVAPSVSGIPFIGWVLAGAATMMGMDQGAEIGGNMATSLADCDPDFQLDK